MKKFINEKIIKIINKLDSYNKLQKYYVNCVNNICDKTFKISFKKIGFVIDLNIGRVLNTCVNYSIYNNEMSLEEKIKYLVDYHLINIDVDMFDNKKLDTNTLITKLMNIWKENPINNLRVLLKNLDNEYLDFDNETQKLLNKSFTSMTKGDNMTLELKNEDDELQSLKSGKEKSSDMESEKNEMEKELEEMEKAEKQISFTKDVLPYVIPLTCILTMKDNIKDFIKMLSDIKNNPELIEIFDEQSLIWWNKTDLINLISEITNKYINKNSNTFNISINFKMGLQSLIDKPKELLELINECLKPKESEKKQFGEVFTPMIIINEMLDKLDDSYKNIHKISIFENKNFKWLDPANGMGNFMIMVYLKLMSGLEKIITDEKKRKKHILENMLYMSEINKKNCYIARQIFDINNNYKLNINDGDTLKLNIKKYFNVDKFDVIVGNPPYNASGSKASGNTIWQDFLKISINSYLKDNGFLCFVHPCGWRKPNTERGKFNGLFDLMTKENSLLYLEIHNTKDGMKTFHCGTRYDWYILKKNKEETTTTIKDEKNIISKINLSKYNWLANCELDEIDKLLATDKDEKCPILQSMSAYEPRKSWMSNKQSVEFKYPVVHSTPKDGTRYVWSNRNDKGFYGVSKIIFGDSGIYNPVIDLNGDYAMTQHAMAIEIKSKLEGEQLKVALSSNKFKEILTACSWSSFAIEWNMFSYFKRDFYKYFLKIEKEDTIDKVNKSIKKVIKRGNIKIV